MQATTVAPSPVPFNAGDLPRFVFSSLARLQPGAGYTSLTPMLEQVVRTVGADRGFLLHLPKEGTTPEVVCQWTRASVSARQPADLRLGTWTLRRVLSGETVSLTRIPEDMPLDSAEDIEWLAEHGIRSLLGVPVVTSHRTVVLVIENLTRPASWGEALRHVTFTTEILTIAVDHLELNQELMQTRADLARVTQRHESDTQMLRDDIRTIHDFDDIVGNSPSFVSALAAVRDVAATDSTVLLLGETGTGKELFARALHERSDRRQRPFVCVNCAALPASLIESELFGHERGAFTGAVSTRQGRFELADHGTIFLDEVGDLPLELQPKLLRVLQEREFERIGSSTRRKVDVRVIAATHHDLRKAVDEGHFRADLYYRLSVFPITLPPLRERPDDIPRLVWFLINQRQRRLHRRITEVLPPVMEALCRYQWPGNVRELENVIERAMIRSTGPILHVDENLTATPVPAASEQGAIAKPAGGTLEDLERAHIEATLRACRGRINGAGNAAERLGLHPNTLRFRMKKLGIVRELA